MGGSAVVFIVEEVEVSWGEFWSSARYEYGYFAIGRASATLPRRPPGDPPPHQISTALIVMSLRILNTHTSFIPICRPPFFEKPKIYRIKRKLAVNFPTCEQDEIY